MLKIAFDYEFFVHVKSLTHHYYVHKCARLNMITYQDTDGEGLLKGQEEIPIVVALMSALLNYMSYVIKYKSDTYGMKTTTVNVIPIERDKKPSECNILNRNHSFGNIRYERLVGIWQRKTAFNQ